MNKPVKKPAASDAPVAGDPAHHVDGMRETIESVVIALILAFLFRTFEAEAFVIPTGSMGPTLMGLHKDIDCPECGFRYQTGVSFEADDMKGRRMQFEGGPLNGQFVIAQTCTCPNCRYTASVDPEHRGPEKLAAHPMSYAGDRIWVSKASYAVSEPKRWDVAVFKWPLGADQNYIKRLVGLPGETVRVFRGDLYTLPLPKTEAEMAKPDTNILMSDFQIARKPAHKVLATLQTVYDNDYLMPGHAKLGWPLRWQAQASEATSAAQQWQPADNGRAYAVDGKSTDDVWLVYHHTVPNFYEAQQLAAGKSLGTGFRPQPQLVTDFCAFDTGTNQYNQPEPDPRSLGVHWVPDLAVECEAEFRGDSGQLTLAIVEAGRLLTCRIDVATGEAQLAIEGLSEVSAKATTTVKGAGTYHLRFANVDDQLRLWVDDEPVEFTGQTEYRLDPPSPASSAPAPAAGPRLLAEPNQVLPTVEDLSPARIASRQLAVEVRHLRVRRDIYYIASHEMCDYQNKPFGLRNAQQITEFFSQPGRWAAMGSLAFQDFPLEADEFLMMGDNSPSSHDSRFWEDRSGNQRYQVARELLIGKAFFVYWPHAWETSPHFTISLRTRDIGVPFYPNFRDMRLIR